MSSWLVNPTTGQGHPSDRGNQADRHERPLVQREVLGREQTDPVDSKGVHKSKSKHNRPWDRTPNNVGGPSAGPSAPSGASVERVVAAVPGVAPLSGVARRTVEATPFSGNTGGA